MRWRRRMRVDEAALPETARGLNCRGRRWRPDVLAGSDLGSGGARSRDSYRPVHDPDRSPSLPRPIASRRALEDEASFRAEVTGIKWRGPTLWSLRLARARAYCAENRPKSPFYASRKR